MASEYCHRSAPSDSRGAKATTLCHIIMGGSLHVGPVCILGGSAEAEIETICVLCVGAIDSTAAGCCQIYAHSLVSVDRLPSRARAGRARASARARGAKKPREYRHGTIFAHVRFILLYADVTEVAGPTACAAFGGSALTLPCQWLPP